MLDVYRNSLRRLRVVFALTAAFFFLSVTQAFAYQYIVEMWDEYGDSWNGGELTVKVNGVTVLDRVDFEDPYYSYSNTGPVYGPRRYFFHAQPGDVVTTTFYAGSWSSECYYHIMDADENILTSDGMGYTVPTGLTYTLPTGSGKSGCWYTIHMHDDFGDAWLYSGSISIYINNTLVHSNVRMTNEHFPEPLLGNPLNYRDDFYFKVKNGDQIKFSWVPDASSYYPSECQYFVFDAFGKQIFADGQNSTSPTAKNTVIGTGACSYDVSIYTAVLGYADKYWARREAPDAHPVQVTLFDEYGTAPTYAKAVYKVGSMPADSTDGVVEAFDLTWAGDYAQIDFSQKISTLALGMSPTVYVKVWVPYDEDPTNNGAAADQQMVFDEKVKGFEDFESWDGANNLIGVSLTNDMGWTTVDLDGGDKWQTVDLGQVMLFHPGGTDDWIFTPAAYLPNAFSTRLQGELAGAAPNTSFDLAFGTAPNPGAMTVFATFSNVNIGGPATFADLFGGYSPYFNTPINGAGDYYVGIHLRSGGVLIDWLKLDKNPSPPPVIGFGQPGADISTFIDDLGASIDLTAIYKQPGKITKTYEVASTTNIYGLNGDFLWDVETTDPWITLIKEKPEPTLQGYNFTPPRPRQHQTFTMTIDPSGLAPGLHTGTLRFYGTLFNDDFKPPNAGLVATNEIFEVKVNLRIVTAGTKNGPKQLTATLPGPFTVAGSPYDFVDQGTGLRLATVEVTNGQINTLTIHCFPNQLPQNLARKMYVTRYWQIDYTGTGWTANINFPYADQEAGMVMDKLQLRGIRQPTPNGPWEDPIMGTTSVSDPATNSVTVNDLNDVNVMGSIALAHPYMIVIKDGREIPQSFSLKQNYPNPFNPTTTIAFDVPEERHVRVAVYNSLGAEVAVLVDEVLAAGRYTRTFDATGLPSGTYVYRLMAGDYVQTERMTLSK